MKYALLAIAASFALSTAAHATSVAINFDGVPTNDLVNGFYSGGTSSSGATGPNLGVDFTGFQTVSGFGETSEPNLAFNAGGPAFANTSFGFTAFSFTAGFFQAGTVNVFSGTGGTGTLLGSLSGLLGDPNAFTLQTITFSGIGRSVTFVGPDATLGVDDFNFTLAGGTGGGVPEPATWAMMLIGFGIVGGAMRGRKTSIRVTYA
jgi:PEP-CTERM motif